MSKIWEGRIKNATDSQVEDFTYSIGIDRSLYIYDIAGTAAYSIGLEKIGVLEKDELKRIIAGLVQLKQNLENENISVGKYEDIHSLVESELYKLIGEPALKIHTGRSRNDQIVLDEKSDREWIGDRLELVDTRKYGRTHVAILRKRTEEPDELEPETNQLVQ